MRAGPTILAAVVVLGCAEGKGTPLAAGSPADSADQVMFGVKVVLADNGLQRAQLFADTAYMYDESTRSELRRVRTIFYTPQGAKNGVLTSRQGTYNSRLGSMEARGSVLVTTDDGRRLETPQLRYDPARNEISSDSVFVFTQGQRRVEGRGFVSDPNMNNIRILSGAKGSGGALTLPTR